MAALLTPRASTQSRRFAGRPAMGRSSSGTAPPHNLSSLTHDGGGSPSRPLSTSPNGPLAAVRLADARVSPPTAAHRREGRKACRECCAASMAQLQLMRADSSPVGSQPACIRAQPGSTAGRRALVSPPDAFRQLSAKASLAHRAAAEPPHAVHPLSRSETLPSLKAARGVARRPEYTTSPSAIGPAAWDCASLRGAIARAAVPPHAVADPFIRLHRSPSRHPAGPAAAALRPSASTPQLSERGARLLSERAASRANVCAAASPERLCGSATRRDDARDEASARSSAASSPPAASPSAAGVEGTRGAAVATGDVGGEEEEGVAGLARARAEAEAAAAAARARAESEEEAANRAASRRRQEEEAAAAAEAARKEAIAAAAAASARAAEEEAALERLIARRRQVEKSLEEASARKEAAERAAKEMLEAEQKAREQAAAEKLAEERYAKVREEATAAAEAAAAEKAKASTHAERAAASNAAKVDTEVSAAQQCVPPQRADSGRADVSEGRRSHDYELGDLFSSHRAAVEAALKKPPQRAARLSASSMAERDAPESARPGGEEKFETRGATAAVRAPGDGHLLATAADEERTVVDGAERAATGREDAKREHLQGGELQPEARAAEASMLEKAGIDESSHHSGAPRDAHQGAPNACCRNVHDRQMYNTMAAEVELELRRQRNRRERQDAIRRAAVEMRLQRFRGPERDFYAAEYIQALWRGRLEREELWYDHLYG
ncbi:hypothetical protein AB1Y20_005494 [Prymnesium parvum]|uniref:Uncharacterized protein n=1 Tax=Prymnesium parvum TaxID=97485 RepID=A0AB34J4E3_PRYPA